MNVVGVGLRGVTKTLKLWLAAWLPAASPAVHVTVVCPTAKVAPEDGPHATRSVPSTASVAVA